MNATRMTRISGGEGLSGSGRKPRAEGVKTGNAGKKLPLAQISVPPDFSSLHSLYASRVRHVIARVLRYRPNEVDDAAQETWLRVWTHLPHYRANAAIYTWIYRIAVNCALGVLRRDKRSGVKLESLEGMVEVCDGEKKLLPRALAFRDRRLESTPDRLALEKIVTRLSPTLRDAYQRHYIGGWTYREMTPGKGRTVTARSRGLRLRAKLKRALGRAGA